MAQLSEQEVRDMVIKWYQLLDVHAPTEELVALVATEGLEMRFPEATLTTVDEFIGWYEGVVRIFFDEIHDMKELDVTMNGDTADVKLVVNWQARVWNPPDAKSKWLGFDAYQTWVVRRAPDDGRLQVVTYIVDELRPMPGSSPL